MVELYMMEREREQAQLKWEGRWQAEWRRLRRSERAERHAAHGPASRLRGLFLGTGKGAALGGS